MMTFKDLKKLVELPLYKEQRVPTVKALEVSGVPVVAEKILENHGSISVYQNGYVIYRAHKRVTVFSLRNCVHYKYDALEGAGHHIEEEEFDEYEWHIRLVLEGEDRIFMNYEIIQGKFRVTSASGSPGCASMDLWRAGTMSSFPVSVRRMRAGARCSGM